MIGPSRECASSRSELMRENGDVYPTVEEIRAMDSVEDWQEFVSSRLFTGVPYVFKDDPSQLDALGAHLAEGLGRASLEFTIVGSAKVGFSLAPQKFPAPFSAYSDIDVVVVDSDLFDVAWHAMLDWNYPRRWRLRGADWEWAKDRQSDLFWGWFCPDRVRYEGLSLPAALRPFRDMSRQWFETFRSVALVNGLETRDVSGRLYRTWKHAHQYHVDGLRKLWETLRKEEQ